jgi:hypothetical protein
MSRRCMNCNGKGYISSGIFNFNLRECRECNGEGYSQDKEIKLSKEIKDEEWHRKNSRLSEICMDLLNFIRINGMGGHPKFKELADYWSGLEKDAPPSTKRVLKTMSELAVISRNQQDNENEQVSPALYP